MRKKKILVSAITLDSANLVPLLTKIKYWTAKDVEIWIYGSEELFSKIDNLNIVSSYKKIVISAHIDFSSRYKILLGSIKRNLIAILNIKQTLSHRFDAIYCISSVLDVILFPVICKIVNKKIKIYVVFDNTVPLFTNGSLISGNILLRILGFLFFKLSVILFKNIDYIFAVKPELKEFLLNKGFSSKKIAVTGNGVEKDLILKAKRKVGLETDALFIGRINEAKGIYDMLEVLARVVKKLTRFKLGIMGSGDEDTVKKFKEKIKNLKLNKNVIFFGFVSGKKKFDILKSCKVFLFLSETESVPIAPLEAVCMGKKTIVYDIDAYNMYRNGEVIRFRQKDFKRISGKIMELLHSKSLVNIAGKKLLNDYSWENIAKIEYMKIISKN